MLSFIITALSRICPGEKHRTCEESEMPLKVPQTLKGKLLSNHHTNVTNFQKVLFIIHSLLYITEVTHESLQIQCMTSCLDGLHVSTHIIRFILVKCTINADCGKTFTWLSHQKCSSKYRKSEKFDTPK